MNNQPIGVFDSGLGGLTVWGELYHMLPHESLIYYGDGKHCPYGDKSREEVLPYVEGAVREMISRGTKLIVIACNAATAMAIEYLRKNFPIPFAGLEPAVKPAAQASHSGVIGVLATRATLNGDLYHKTSERFAGQVKIIPRVGEGFVELVEHNLEQSDEALAQVRRVLGPMLEEGADQIVLGCTHYPFLKEAMLQVIGSRPVQLVNPAEAIARQVSFLLTEFSLRADEGHMPHYEFLTCGDETYRRQLIAKSETLR